ncbi:hypothetical protein Moror_12861 [Moniliophthora roreri MCA 2997]|uniref:Uncharacterized protein n=1 Tax=Moniliophthora roreri (strain MCA 2997) TaxID=1381753 RepID=V2XND9_MONRO|nr:hypothetical protein Moror_12861 [Moniliophthora roreri MCA 2997]
MDLDILKAKLAALWMESAFWGMYTVLFVMCIFILGKKTGRVNKVLLGTATVMYVLSTGHVTVNFARAIVAFVEYEHAGGALAYYIRLWDWSAVVREIIFTTLCIVADALLIYRLWAVWGYRMRIAVLPTTFLLAGTVCAFIGIWGLTRISPGEDDRSGKVYSWVIAAFSMTLATNVTVTVLIAGRIWWAGREVESAFDGKYVGTYRQVSGILGIVLESGAICSVFQLFTAILYGTGTNAVFLSWDPLAQVIGIAPTIIIVRVGLGVDFQHSITTSSPSPQMTTAPNDTYLRSWRPDTTSIQLQIHKIVEMTNDTERVIKQPGSRHSLP